MRKHLLKIAAVGLLFSLASCLKDIEDVKVDSWQPEVAIPVLNTSVSLEELLDKFETGGYIQKDSDNFLTLVYQGEIFSQRGDDMISLPDFAVPMADTSERVPYRDLPFDFTLNKVRLKGGSFNYNLESKLPEDAEVTIQIPNFVKDGKMLEMDMTIGSNAVMNNSFELNGYELHFDHDLELRYMAYAVSGGERKKLDNVNFSFNNLEYSYVEGQFGQYAFDLPLGRIVLDLFAEASSGRIFFEDPRISLTFHNSFGLPIRLKADMLRAQTQYEGQLTIASPLEEGVDFAYPGLEEAGSIKSTSVTLNKETANISEVIAANPQEIEYEFSALTGADAVGFAMDTSRFSIDVDVEFPLWFKAEGFVYETIQPFSLTDLDQIEKVEFKLVTENGLPIDSDMQVYFENAQGQVLDSLLTTSQKLISAGLTDGSGKVIEADIHSETIAFSAGRIDIIREATQVRLRAKLATSNNGSESVKIYSDYTVQFKLGAKATLKSE